MFRVLRRVELDQEFVLELGLILAIPRGVLGGGVDALRLFGCATVLQLLLGIRERPLALLLCIDG